MSSSQGIREHSLAPPTNVPFAWRCHSNEPKTAHRKPLFKDCLRRSKVGKNVSTHQKQEGFVFSSKNNSPEMLWNPALEEALGLLFHGLLFHLGRSQHPSQRHFLVKNQHTRNSIQCVCFTQTHQGWLSSSSWNKIHLILTTGAFGLKKTQTPSLDTRVLPFFLLLICAAVT